MSKKVLEALRGNICRLIGATDRSRSVYTISTPQV